MCKQIWPESQFPMRRVGRLMLNQNIQNFFNEAEQLAFSPSHIVPGEFPLQEALTPRSACHHGDDLQCCCADLPNGETSVYTHAKIGFLRASLSTTCDMSPCKCRDRLHR